MHRGAGVVHGKQTAFCTMRPINLRKSSWTVRNHLVTCKTCLRLLREMEQGERR